MSFSRRQFLEITATSGGGLLATLTFPGIARAAARAPAEPVPLGAFIRINPDNTVVIGARGCEIGQGVRTSLPMLIAEELEVPWSRVRVEQLNYGIAPGKEAGQFTSRYGPQGAGGSTSISDGWTELRQAGAQVRELLVATAAQAWNTPPSSLKARDGAVWHPDGRSLELRWPRHQGRGAAAARGPLRAQANEGLQSHRQTRQGRRLRRHRFGPRALRHRRHDAGNVVCGHRAFAHVRWPSEILRRRRCSQDARRARCGAGRAAGGRRLQPQPGSGRRGGGGQHLGRNAGSQGAEDRVGCGPVGHGLEPRDGTACTRARRGQRRHPDGPQRRRHGKGLGRRGQTDRSHLPGSFPRAFHDGNAGRDDRDRWRQGEAHRVPAKSGRCLAHDCRNARHLAAQRRHRAAALGWRLRAAPRERFRRGSRAGCAAGEEPDQAHLDARRRPEERLLPSVRRAAPACRDRQGRQARRLGAPCRGHLAQVARRPG